MTNNKHLTQDNRCTIQTMLSDKDSFKSIAEVLDKDPLKPPYVYNGCDKRNLCNLEKRFYYASDAQKEYELVLSESRSGISLSEAEVRHLETLFSPLIRQKQSPHHICATNKDSIMVSERTIYRLIDSRILSAMNMDLPRKVRFSARKNKVHLKVDKTYRIGRTFECFNTYLSEHPDIPVVQLDSAEGTKGGKFFLPFTLLRPN